MSTMKEKKEKKLWVKGVVLRLNLKLVHQLGTKGKPYSRTLIWEAFPVIKAKRPNMVHPK